jgi:hypothetical protein
MGSPCSHALKLAAQRSLLYVFLVQPTYSGCPTSCISIHLRAAGHIFDDATTVADPALFVKQPAMARVPRVTTSWSSALQACTATPRQTRVHQVSECTLPPSARLMYCYTGLSPFNPIGQPKHGVGHSYIACIIGTDLCESLLPVHLDAWQCRGFSLTPFSRQQRRIQPLVTSDALSSVFSRVNKRLTVDF